MWGEPSFVCEGYRRRSRQDVELFTSLRLVPSLRMRVFVLPPSHVYVWLARGLLSFILLMICALLYCFTLKLLLRSELLCNRKSDKRDLAKYNKEVHITYIHKNIITMIFFKDK